MAGSIPKVYLDITDRPDVKIAVIAFHMAIIFLYFSTFVGLAAGSHFWNSFKMSTEIIADCSRVFPSVAPL